jgi:hypothetical protein
MTSPLPPRTRKRCIPIYRPHRWHWDSYSTETHVLVLRCSRCYKIKVIKDWNE